MENFNKVLSFILGLIVVIVFVIVLSGRLNLKNKFLPFAGISPTPTSKEQGKKTTPTPTTQVNQYQNQTNQPTPTLTKISKGGKTSGQAKGSLTQAQSIPATGSPTLLLPLLGSSALLGFYLRKRR